MRIVLSSQLKVGEVDISAIVLDPKSRDDIPKLLIGLQHIYTHTELRARVFSLLAELRPERSTSEGKVSVEVGRPGMDQWKILVLGTLRLALNADYDRIVELANEHSTLRQMLGHSKFDNSIRYELQTVKDNLRLFSPELLAKINDEVVKAGHALIKKKDLELELNARVDSFVVETDVHFPTDVSLLYDSTRKMLELCGRLCEQCDVSEWRQFGYHISKFKSQCRTIQKIKHSTSKDEQKRNDKEDELVGAYEVLAEMATDYMNRVKRTRDSICDDSRVNTNNVNELDAYIQHTERQIGQIIRRVVEGEVIPHAEKVFSIFEPHTEWISKGKAGVPVELGLRVCVVEDQHGFILHHHVMVKETDDQVAVEVAKHTKSEYPQVKSFSYDKGFHSPSNQKELRDLVDLVVLPKKGKLSEKRRSEESEPEFKRLRRKHSAVESAINALEVHGLDYCPDHGLVGFERYVAMAVLARNVHHIGAILAERAASKQRRREKSAA